VQSDHRPTTDRPPTDHRPTTDQQLRIDYDAAELCGLLRACGVRARLQLALMVHALRTCGLSTVHGRRVLVIQRSERGLARDLSASKSGLREAVEALEARGLVRRGPGAVAVLWDAVCDLEPPDPLDWLEPTSANARSEGGRKVVGTRNLQEQETITIHPSTLIPNPTPPNLDPTTDRPALGRVRLRDLQLPDGRLNRAGLVDLYSRGVAAGHFAAVEPMAEFAHLVGLARYATDRQAMSDAGIDSPCAWLVSAVRRGVAQMRSQPGPEHWDSARQMVERADGLEAEVRAGVGRRGVQCQVTV
jgi:hypothetical protein